MFQKLECKWPDIKVNGESVVYGCNYKEFCGFNEGNESNSNATKTETEYKNGKCSRIKTDSPASSLFKKFLTTDLPITNLTAHLNIDIFSIFNDGNGISSATADGDPIALWMNNAQPKGNLICFEDNQRPTLKLNVVNGHGVIHFDGADVYLFNKIVYYPLTHL